MLSVDKEATAVAVAELAVELEDILALMIVTTP